jgi:hypothetical protein
MLLIEAAEVIAEIAALVGVSDKMRAVWVLPRVDRTWIPAAQREVAIYRAFETQTARVGS